MSKKTIFSGVQPSGNFHLGNYLGAIRNWVQLQEDYNSIFCVVDLHAITAPQDPGELRKKTIEIAKIYLAAGINPEKASIFIQSHIPEHSELMWILNTIVKISELEKMTQFKDKSGNNFSTGIDAGLLNYPTLMAADILLYDTEAVPVGEDQLQHIELARVLAKRFNHRFGEAFTVPKAHIKEETMRIMGLDNPAKKMSKSAQSALNRIELLDPPEEIKKKIMKAVTDSDEGIEYSDDRPALKNLINIFSAITEKNSKQVVEEFHDKGYKDFKESLADAVIEFLAPFQEKYHQISDDEVLETLKRGAEKVRPLAQKKMEDVKSKLGFVL